MSLSDNARFVRDIDDGAWRRPFHSRLPGQTHTLVYARKRSSAHEEIVVVADFLTEQGRPFHMAANLRYKRELDISFSGNPNRTIPSTKIQERLAAYGPRIIADLKDCLSKRALLTL